MLCNPNGFEHDPEDLMVKSWVAYFFRDGTYTAFTFPDQEAAELSVPWIALIEDVDLTQIRVSGLLNEYNKETRR